MYSVASIDVVSERLDEYVSTGVADWTSGQFPVVSSASGKPRMVFETMSGQVYFVGAP